MSHIELTIKGKTKDLGDGFVVTRSLPDAKKRLVGPFIFWDHMGPAHFEGEQEMKVRSHPHIGLATLTYLFEGAILHRDSLGNEQYIKPGEVNWMTAGSGITHSERAHPLDGKPFDLEGIQLWIALPKESEEIEARFDHFKETELPMFEDQGFSLRLIAGEAHGLKSPVPVYSKLFYMNGKGSAGSEYFQDFSAEVEGAVYVVKGEIEVEGQTFGSKELVIFEKGSSLSFKNKTDVEVMLFGGKVFPEKRYIYWNFVSSSKERLEQAKRDWKEGRFPKTINEREFIPLPEE